MLPRRQSRRAQVGQRSHADGRAGNRIPVFLPDSRRSRRERRPISIDAVDMPTSNDWPSTATDHGPTHRMPLQEPKVLSHRYRGQGRSRPDNGDARRGNRGALDRCRSQRLRLRGRATPQRFCGHSRHPATTDSSVQSQDNWDNRLSLNSLARALRAGCTDTACTVYPYTANALPQPHDGLCASAPCACRQWLQAPRQGHRGSSGCARGESHRRTAALP